MESVTLNLKTSTCGVCGYYQDFNSLDNPQLHARIFPNVPAGKCPACFTGQTEDRVVRKNSTLYEVVDLAQMAKSTSAGDDELRAKTEIEFDNHGLPVMVKSGEREKIAIVDGKATVVLEDIMEPKQRELTKQELADLKAQRDRNLDELEKVAV